jgi:HEAT repeat protein
LIIETLNALALMRDDRALPSIAALARKKKWTAWGKTTQLRQSCVQTLSRIGTPKARETIADLAASGDFFLKRLVRKAALS